MFQIASSAVFNIAFVFEFVFVFIFEILFVFVFTIFPHFGRDVFHPNKYLGRYNGQIKWMQTN